MMIPKKATKAKSPDDRIDEYVGKIEELVNSHFNSKGQSVKYHLGKPSALGKRFRDLYGNWKCASFCIEISSPN